MEKLASIYLNLIDSLSETSDINKIDIISNELVQIRNIMLSQTEQSATLLAKISKICASTPQYDYTRSYERSEIDNLITKFDKALDEIADLARRE